MNWKEFFERNKYKLLFLAIILPSLIITLIAIATPTPITYEGRVEYNYDFFFISHYVKELMIIIIFSFLLYIMIFKVKAIKSFLEPTKLKILILVIISVSWLIYHCESIKDLCIAILPFNLVSVTFSLFSEFYHKIYQYIGVWPPEMSILALFSFFIYFLSSLLIWIHEKGRKNININNIFLDFRKIILFFLINDFFMISTISYIIDGPTRIGFPLVFLIKCGACIDIVKTCICEDYFSLTNLLLDFIFWYICSFIIVWVYDKAKKKS